MPIDRRRICRLCFGDRVTPESEEKMNDRPTASFFHTLRSIFPEQAREYVLNVHPGRTHVFGRLDVDVKDTRVSRTMLELRVGPHGDTIELKNTGQRRCAVKRHVGGSSYVNPGQEV